MNAASISAVLSNLPDDSLEHVEWKQFQVCHQFKSGGTTKAAIIKELIAREKVKRWGKGNSAKPK